MSDRHGDRPAEPQAREQTIRRQIAALLARRQADAKDISRQVGIPEKAVWDHLVHIERSCRRGAASLEVQPAACRDCGFVFAKRQRLQTPSRCPRCHSEAIEPPRFSLTAPL